MLFEPANLYPVLPEPSADAQAHSELLSERIRGQIAAAGPITFAQFMQSALYEPELGYYMAGLHKFGIGGDFITAPEVSCLFSFCLAEQCMDVLRSLGQGAILEIGAGSGVMAADILTHLAAADCLPEHYFILELSAELRQRQQTLLQQRIPVQMQRVRWLTDLEGLNFSGVILANEVLDAMPVNRFCHDGSMAQELCVDWSQTQKGFVWTLKPAAGEFRQALNRIESGLEHSFVQGYISEVNLFIRPWLNTLWRNMRNGVLLLIDYGYPRSEYYLPERGMGTLSCHYRHRSHADPFKLVGLQDITAFVDFTAVAEAGVEAGFELGGFLDQAGFLLNCGIENIYARQSAQPLHLAQQMKTLLLPSEMGERFKCLALHKAYNRDLIGFGKVDHRHRL